MSVEVGGIVLILRDIAGAQLHVIWLMQCFPNCVPWCAASIFKVLYVDTKFLPKLRKCCYEVIVDLCRKSRVAL